MARPGPTLLYRLTHLANLELFARRGGIHAPAHAPDDGLVYRGIHDRSIGLRRGGRRIPCGPGGTVDDYVSFYLCTRSPMLYRIQADHDLCPPEGPGVIVYLVSSVEKIEDSALGYVFSDGHGLQALTHWYERREDLDQLDWNAIRAGFWRPEEDPDLARRKQAEFLVHRHVPWQALLEIGRYDRAAKVQAERQLVEFAAGGLEGLEVKVRSGWYYAL